MIALVEEGGQFLLNPLQGRMSREVDMRICCPVKLHSHRFDSCVLRILYEVNVMEH